MQQPLVSVIIPVYNVESYVERCARSLFEQTLDDIEYVFVDDCSTDGSVAALQRVVDAYPSRAGRVRLLQHDANQGAAKARLTGLEHATGRFIAFCDSDDWVEPRMYQTLVRAAMQNDADIAVCDFNMAEPAVTEHCRFEDWSSDKDLTISRYVGNLWGGALWSMLVSRSVYKSLRAHSHDCMRGMVGIAYGEAFNVTMHLLHYSKKVVNVHEYLYNYDRTREDTARRKIEERYARAVHDYIASTLDLVALYGDRYPAVRKALSSRLGVYVYHLGNIRRQFDQQYPGFIRTLLDSKALKGREKLKYRFYIYCNGVCRAVLKTTKFLTE